jgi:hypothetical protein
MPLNEGIKTSRKEKKNDKEKEKRKKENVSWMSR